MSISNRTRDAIKEKFGVHMNKVLDEAGDNIMDFTKDDIKLSEDLELATSTGFEKKEVNFEDTQYMYKGLKQLIPEEPAVRRGENIYICNFYITKTYVAPFISFNLYRYDDNMLSWPTISYEGGSVMNVIKNKMEKVFHLWEVESQYKGYIRYKDKVYVWFENSYPKNMIKELVQGKKDDRWWDVLISEIMNEKKTLYFSISDKVTTFFIENLDFCFFGKFFG